AGVADACREARIAVFGPSAAAARIESSKTFAKQLMDSAAIPTARWRAGGADERAALHGFIEELEGRCVVKADGLALGKGVVVCDDAAQARAAVAACLDEHRFGAAGSRVLVEERLSGPEVSVQALVDGGTIRLLPPARDYKRIGDRNTGPNTGGMGAVTPPPGVSDDVAGSVVSSVLRPCVDALAAAGTPFTGCLYAGVMLTDTGPRVLEFNARFGDPEAQVVLPVLDEDVLELLSACAIGGLAPGTVQRGSEGCAVGIVLAAAGYPGAPRRGDVISGLNTLSRDILAFQAGTVRSGDRLLTDGGRVITLVARGGSVDAARQRAYGALTSVHFDGMQHRSDIGRDQAGEA
ncbi:MAG TPA: phosphoribosylamine--glycine ligase, partial [Candidatus Dormibacteraeota bacterium]|nr:phosphoribosylamine--glycine ligase [Candidatus Dormibacteraeota bacterium]